MAKMPRQYTLPEDAIRRLGFLRIMIAPKDGKEPTYSEIVDMGISCLYNLVMAVAEESGNTANLLSMMESLKGEIDVNQLLQAFGQAGTGSNTESDPGRSAACPEKPEA